MILPDTIIDIIIFSCYYNSHYEVTIMKSLKYFEQLENFIYKCTLENDIEMLKFLKDEERRAFNNLTNEEISELLDSVFINHPSLLMNQVPTDTLIIYQIDNKLPLKRLINKLIANISLSQNNEVAISQETNNYLINEGIEQMLISDCLAFRTDYIERIIGRVFESRDIEEKVKDKIIKDLFFTYSELEEDKKNLHNIKSANILAKRFNMVGDFINKAKQDGVYISLCMENILANIENGDVICSGKKALAKSTYADIQLESLLSPLPIMDLVNVREQLNYEFYINNNNLENGIYYKETEKTLKKLLINNINN